MTRMRAFMVSTTMMLAIAMAHASETLTFSLDFHAQALDLDSGAVMEVSEPLDAFGADIRLVYTAKRTPHAVVVPVSGSGAQLAFVQGVAFDGVTMDSLDGLSFSDEAMDLPFSANDTVVVRTGTGATYKLGNAVEGAETVTFNTSAVQ